MNYIFATIVYLNLTRIIYKYVNNAENQGRRFFFTMPVSDRGKMKQNADINHSYLCYRYMCNVPVWSYVLLSSRDTAGLPYKDIPNRYK